MASKYVVLESASLKYGLKENTNQTKKMFSTMKKATSKLTNAIKSGELQGKTYESANDYFMNVLSPLVKNGERIITDVYGDINMYELEESKISHYGNIDVDALKKKIQSKQKLKREAEKYVDFAEKHKKLLTFLNPLSSASAEYSAKAIIYKMDKDIPRIEEEIDAFNKFEFNTSRMFSDSLKALHALENVLDALKDTKISSDGTINLPKNIYKLVDKLNCTGLNINSKYQSILSELLSYDSEGLVAHLNYFAISKYLMYLAAGDLSKTEEKALLTALEQIFGNYVKLHGFTKEVNDICVILSILQVRVGLGNRFLGFAYDKKRKCFYTTQHSLQSRFGFTGFYDKVDPLLGMDLNTDQIDFTYNGKQYRFQVWKGSYGDGLLGGGEQGLYVFDPKNKNQVTEKNIYKKLGMKDWLPVASKNDRIHMTNTLYNKTTGKEIMKTSDTNKNLNGEKAYWNLANKTAPGYTKENIYAEGTLDIKDKKLRTIIYTQLKNKTKNGKRVFSNVYIKKDGSVHYIWGK
ncbi:MAG: DUF4474 domain-containing protein [Lachnospiraceae bacterium]|nr:DUF4474 domain-containing protein [Lachnospiraceae bacterium]